MIAALVLAFFTGFSEIELEDMAFAYIGTSTVAGIVPYLYFRSEHKSHQAEIEAEYSLMRKMEQDAPSPQRTDAPP